MTGPESPFIALSCYDLSSELLPGEEGATENARVVDGDGFLGLY